MRSWCRGRLVFQIECHAFETKTGLCRVCEDVHKTLTPTLWATDELSWRASYKSFTRRRSCCCLRLFVVVRYSHTQQLARTSCHPSKREGLFLWSFLHTKGLFLWLLLKKLCSFGAESWNCTSVTILWCQNRKTHVYKQERTGGRMAVWSVCLLSRWRVQMPKDDGVHMLYVRTRDICWTWARLCVLLFMRTQRCVLYAQKTANQV